MGEAIIVVSINGKAYIIEKGHNNNDMVAVEMALKKHKERTEESQRYFNDNNIKDTNGVPIDADFSINEIRVCYGVEV